MTLQTNDGTTVAASRPGILAQYRDATFSSLGLRNYRLYFIGQGISLCGTWMQMVAQSWLVWVMTHSGAMLGSVAAFQFLPVLCLAPYGGLLADRFSKRRLLFVTQSAAAVLAITLGALYATGALRLWMLFVFAGAVGTINALDNPTRQSFVHELAGPGEIKNAVTLNSLEVNLSRVVGPAIAGVLIARVGLTPCFFFNGLSFLAVLVCLGLMRSSELHRSARVAAAKGQLAEGFRYVRSSPVILVVLVMMTIVGTLTYEFQVTLTMLAGATFRGTAGTYALLTSAMGVGAVIGGLAIAGRSKATIGALVIAAFAFGVSTLLLAVAPNLVLAVISMLLVGACSIAFTSLTNTILQIESAPTMRGRVMSLWAMAFLGSTLVGAPLVGWVGQRFDPRLAIGVGGVAAFLAGAIGLFAIHSAAVGGTSLVPIGTPLIAEKEDYV